VYLDWITTLDAGIAALVPPLAVVLLIIGLDDLLVDAVWLASRQPAKPAGPPLNGKLAVMVPLWCEQGVIEAMLAHNLAAIRDTDFELFAGCYPNDEATQEAVHRARQRDHRIQLALCSAPGPTSKADCLNAIWRAIQNREQAVGVRFEIFVIHDAEDLIHPESFTRLRQALHDADMVQIPVLALPTPLHEFPHGVYCDEFAEYQTRDMQARSRMDAFVPSTGVGTGFRRRALEALALARDGMPFEPESLTEDYECGLRLHALGFRQRALPVLLENGMPLATREYFPRTWRGAVRQRTRWVMGNALDAWRRHGWRGNAVVRYWLWRDRKGLVGNPLSLLANAVLAYGVIACATGRNVVLPDLAWLNWLLLVNLALALERLSVRIWCVSRVYGWMFAMGVPLRQFYANIMNSVASAMAIVRFTAARLRRRRFIWLKTEHQYPTHMALAQHKPALETVMVTMGLVAPETMEEVRRNLPGATPLAAALLRAGYLNEEDYYRALSVHGGLPLASVEDTEVTKRCYRTLPARAAEEYRLFPFRIESGEIHVASPLPPSDRALEDLSKLTRLRVVFHLMPESRFEEITSRLAARDAR
jgi:adsorption protein B